MGGSSSKHTVCLDGGAPIEVDRGRGVAEISNGPQDSDIACYHVSCKSCALDDSRNLVGVVFYLSENSETQWVSKSGVRMRSGYIFLARDDVVTAEFPNEPGKVHGSAYRKLMGESINDRVTANGFAIMKGEWKFNSSACQENGPFKSQTRSMTDFEQGIVKECVLRWHRTGKQNLTVKEHIGFVAQSDCGGEPSKECLSTVGTTAGGDDHRNACVIS